MMKYFSLLVLIVSSFFFVNCSCNKKPQQETDLIEALRTAIYKGNLEEVKRLIDNGADINAKGKEYGLTPLHYAASCSDKEIVQLLVKKGADKQAKDTKGKTPLDYAERHNENGSHDEVIALLK